MKSITINRFDGIKPHFQQDIFEVMRSCDNKERLLVCLYLMSDLLDERHKIDLIEQNLRCMFPPSVPRGRSPDDYEDFQASAIRFLFNLETRQVKQKQLSLKERLWQNVGKGCWRNTPLGNQQAQQILRKQGVLVERADKILPERDPEMKESDSIEKPQPKISNPPNFRRRVYSVSQTQPPSSQEAFTILLAEIEVALQDSLSQYNTAIQQGNFESAELEADRQKNLVGARHQLQGLRELWSTLVGQPILNPKPKVELAQSIGKQSKKAKPKKRRERKFGERLPRGAKTQEKEFWLPILTALEETGGSRPVTEVLNRVSELMAGTLNEFDLGSLKRGQVRWHNTAEWARQKMKDEGLLVNNSPHGIWEITEQGRAFLQSEHAKNRK